MTVEQARQQKFFRQHEAKLWLLLIVAVATALRFTGLTFQSYWFDELYSAYYSNPAHSLARVIELTLADVHPPLHQLSMWISYKIFGYNEFAGRLSSALAGVLAIPVIYLLGREMFDRRTGLYAAALATPNYFLLYYAQEARSYALLYFMACLSSLFFLRALRSASWLNLLLYAAATIALLYTHYFAFVMLAIQGCIFLLYWTLYARGDRQLLIRAGIAVLLVVAALVPLLPTITQHAAISGFWIRQPSVFIAVSYFINYFGSPLLAVCIAVLLVVALFAAILRALRSPGTNWVVFSVTALLVWIVLGFFLPWVRGLFAQPVIMDRNTIMLVPPILILAAFGLRCIPVLLLQRMAGVAVLGLSLYHLLAGIHYYSAVTKNQYREITAAIAAYEPILPVYALMYNDTKYNTYFTQLNSSLRATDYQLLLDKLEAGTAEPLFWLVGGHLFLRDKTLAERYGLLQVASYSFLRTFAELLLDPRAATPVALERAVLSGKRENWLSAKPFVWQDNSTQLLIALNGEARTDPRRKVQVDLLDINGHVLETHAAELGAIPSTMQISPQLRAGTAVRLVVRMPAGEAEPRVWVLHSASSAR